VVHKLWDDFFGVLDEGAKPWALITACKARERLRQMLHQLGVPGAEKHGTHDLRRGHAEAPLCQTERRSDCNVANVQDMRKSGSTLAEILMAGQWKSTAFLKVLDEVGITWLAAVCLRTCALEQADLEKETAFAVAIESDEEAG